MSYFAEHMAKQDYLTKKGQVEMTWYGEGADRLGLRGQVQEDHFARLCAGRDPFTDKKLTPRDGGPNRRVCYFGQISAPKDASIAYLVGDDKRIAGWWEESVKDTLKEIEGVIATRVRLGGVVNDRPTGNMVAAVVTHDTSRALDPQLHTHVCVMNVTFDAVENRWKAVEPRGFYRYQSYFREVSYNKLAEKMRSGGYEIEKARPGGFNIAGFSDELRTNFSKRREQIERVADGLNTRNQDTLQSIATRTRANKTQLTSRELKSQWQSEAESHLPQIRQIIATAKPSGDLPIVSASRYLELAEEHVFERQSVVDERILLREALIFGRGEVRLSKLREALDAKLQSGELIQNGRMIASPKTLGMEKSIIEWVDGSKGSLPRMGQFQAQDSLTPEQNHAAERLLETRDRAVVLIGDAGAGKSTTLPVIIRGVHETGNLTFACAPSSGAVQELRETLGIQADTIQQLLVNEKLQEQIAGRTIIVDEAGLLAVRQMQELCQLADRRKCRLLLVGDVKQHHSVEAGDALRALEKYAGVETVRLKEIHRQKSEEYRKVVRLLASGKTHPAFGQLDKMGGVREEKEWDKLLNQASSTYLEKTKTGQSCLVISPVWSEVNAFTAVLRARLQENGSLGAEEKTYQSVQSMQWTRSSKTQLANYQTGDVITFHQAGAGFTKHEMVRVVAKGGKELTVERADGTRMQFDPREQRNFDVGLSRSLAIASGERLLVRSNFAPAKIKNGDVVTIREVKEDGSLILQDGRIIPPHFRQFTHGYATTSHAAQGKTVDHGILVLGEKGSQAANLKQAYVSNSRFRYSQTIFTIDKNAAYVGMGKEDKRALAIEAMKSDPMPMTVSSKMKSGGLDWSPRIDSLAVRL